jgi:hypothetical protein
VGAACQEGEPLKNYHPAHIKVGQNLANRPRLRDQLQHFGFEVSYLLGREFRAATFFSTGQFQPRFVYTLSTGFDNYVPFGCDEEI